jgi:hypothetical protein
MSALDLKPCPFCGKPAELTENEYSAPMVACEWCLARACSHSDSLAIDKWNRRPGEDALHARAEAAEAALATAQAEGAAAERAAVVACLHGGADAHSGFGRSVVAVALRDHVAYIEAGAHVRAVEGA